MSVNHSIPKVSIIVPVYNAGMLLNKCLETLLNQTLKEIEIIIVLDCPSDKSDVLAKKYAAQDDRIVIVENKTNLHIGKSRNEGLKVARGEYIGFSDHDDYRELDMYDKLYEKAVEEQSNMVFSLPDSFSDNYAITSEMLKCKNKEQLHQAILSDLIGFGNFHYGAFFVNVTTNIYRNDFLKKHHITFIDTNKKSPEDLLFQVEAITASNSISYVDKLFYHHVAHPSNEGTQGSYTGYRKRSKGLKYLYAHLNENGIFKDYEENFYHAVRKQFLNSLIALLVKAKGVEFLRAVKMLCSYSFTNAAFVHYPYERYKNFGNKWLERFLVKLLRKLF